MSHITFIYMGFCYFNYLVADKYADLSTTYANTNIGTAMPININIFVYVLLFTGFRLLIFLYLILRLSIQQKSRHPPLSVRN